jgi:microcystin-dependent protein
MANPFLGEIKMFGGNFAPSGFAFCNGQLLPIDQNDALFAILGTIYGGNGTTNFALPNLQGRAPLHPGQGSGLSPRALGEVGGVPAVTLLTPQMPSHQHQANCVSSSAANQTAPTGGLWALGLAHQMGQNFYSSAPGTGTTMNAQALPATGGGVPHNNMPPYLVVNFIIALNGIFPSRN